MQSQLRVVWVLGLRVPARAVQPQLRVVIRRTGLAPWVELALALVLLLLLVVVLLLDVPLLGGKARLLIRKYDHFTPAREMRRDVRALTARNHPEGRYYPMQRHALWNSYLRAKAQGYLAHKKQGSNLLELELEVAPVHLPVPRLRRL